MSLSVANAVREADDEALVELAVAAGSEGFSALNLRTEVFNPDAHAHLRR